VNTLGLIREIERLRPQATSLIQTILESGDVAGSTNSAVVNENGEPIASLRTIVRAMEVLNDFCKTQDFNATVPSRAVHCYYVVERAVSEQRLGGGRERQIQPGGPEASRIAGDV